MLLAASHSYLNISALILSKGLPPNSRDEEGWSLIHYAAFWGDIDFMRVCVRDLQLKSDTETDDGRTPLHMTALRGHLDLVQVFEINYEI